MYIKSLALYLGSCKFGKVKYENNEAGILDIDFHHDIYDKYPGTKQRIGNI
jgi:hypothetical protein